MSIGQWERLIAGVDMIGGTGSESSLLPVVVSVEFATCGSSSRSHQHLCRCLCHLPHSLDPFCFCNTVALVLSQYYMNEGQFG